MKGEFGLRMEIKLSPATLPRPICFFFRKRTVASGVFLPPRDWKLVQKIRQFEKSGVKLQCSTEERETTFGSSYREKMRVWEIRIPL